MVVCRAQPCPGVGGAQDDATTPYPRPIDRPLIVLEILHPFLTGNVVAKQDDVGLGAVGKRDRNFPAVWPGLLGP